MSPKKVFQVLLAVSIVTFLVLHYGDQLKWTWTSAESFNGAPYQPTFTPEYLPSENRTSAESFNGAPYQPTFTPEYLPSENRTTAAYHLGFLGPCSNSSLGLKPKHTNVVFLKTHKTGSSTMQNLLFRFAERHNLTVALPTKACKGYLFCYPHSFNSSFIRPGTLPANIIASHMRFNHTEVQRLMPDNTAYFTIFREPVSMFESIFTYFKEDFQTFNKVPLGSLKAFLEEPWKYYNAEEEIYPARNALTFDLGGDKDRPVTDAAYIRDFVAEVDRTFSLVMIAEYFDESLVLLRHLLSWDLDDVLYVKLNMRSDYSKGRLTPDLRAKILDWNSLDAQLYDHFNASLWEKLAALGPACVAEEVRLLRQAQEKVMQSCFGSRKPRLRGAKQIKNKLLQPYEPSEVEIMGYDLSVTNGSLTNGSSSRIQDLCLKLLMPEKQYTDILLRSQNTQG